MGKPKFNEQQKAEILRLHNEGVKTAEIARMMNAGESSVGRILRQAGVPPKTQYISNMGVGYERNKDIVDDRKNGISLGGLADKYGVSEAVIVQRLRMEGVKPGEYCPPSGPPDDSYIKMFLDGLSLSEIGRHYGIDHHSISKWLENAGVRKRIRREVSEETRMKLSRSLSKEETSEIIRMYTKEEKSVEEIETIIGCSHSSVSRILHKNKIKMRNPGEGTSSRGLKISRVHLGKKRTQETRDKMSRSIAYSPMFLNRRNKFETDVENMLVELSVDFVPQVPFLDKETHKHFVCDFVINGNVALECFGTYYHCDPRFYIYGPVNEIQKTNIEKDKRRFSVYKDSGYKVAVLWEIDFDKRGIDALKDIIGR